MQVSKKFNANPEQPAEKPKEITYGIFKLDEASRKLKIEVDDRLLCVELNDMGYYQRGQRLVHVADNVVTVLDNAQVLHQRIAAMIREYESYDHIVNGYKVVFTYATFESVYMKWSAKVNYNNHAVVLSLPEFEGDILRDDAHNMYFTFRNGYVHINKEGAKFKPYSTLKGKFVFASQLIKHDYDEKASKPSEYDKFVTNLGYGKKPNRERLMWALGYMCHTYHNPAKAKVTILYDDSNDKGRNGGTGKDVLLQGVKHIRETVFLDGEQWSIKNDNTFFFAPVRESTQFIIISDPKYQSLFDSLFVKSQGPFITQRKFKDNVELPLESTPKIALSSNVIFDATSSSHKRRQFPHILAPKYRDLQKSGIAEPIVHVHGKAFYADWTVKEWNAFYQDMVRYAIHYLTTPQPDTNFDKLSEQAFGIKNGDIGKFILMNTTPNCPKELNLSKLVDEYLEAYIDVPTTATEASNLLTATTTEMSNLLRKWLDIRGIKYTVQRVRIGKGDDKTRPRIFKIT